MVCRSGTISQPPSVDCELDAVVGAWLIHLYTASGVVLGFLAVTSITEQAYQRAFLLLFVATVIDSTDGFLARRFRVSEKLPWFNGALLDNLVDYVTYVFVPVLLVSYTSLVPAAVMVPICASMLLASAYGFSQSAAKTDDHFFTGFPSYWNIVVFYLYIANWPLVINAVVLIVFVVLVFVPLKYIYRSKTVTLRRTTITLGIVWTAIIFVLVLQVSTGVSRILFWSSFVFPVYYLLVSYFTHFRLHRVGVDAE